MRGIARDLLQELSESPEGEAVEAHLLADRFRTAAWLAWQHRAQLRRNGAVQFEIPAEAATPPWFRVAMEQFRRRQWWSVTRATRAGVRRYVVRWLGHGTWRRHVPREVLAPLGPAR